jgi:8-oxo-dGTP diphosphatase
MTDTGQRAYDSSQYPAFAVTVDVAVFTMVAGHLNVLLVKRAGEPFAGTWALPGGFKLPNETLDQAAHRELQEETAVDGSALLRQLGAYGDPGRDPRMNVVTVAYLAVGRDLEGVAAGSDAAEAALHRVHKVVNGRLPLAFDHRRIVRDALDRIGHDLETTGLATAFVGPTFTLTELRAVFEEVWQVRLDGANFRRKLSAADGWVVPTGRRVSPGSDGGKPAELFKAGRAWTAGGPMRRPRTERTGRR